MGVWPDAAQSACTFTVHFDAETLWTSIDEDNRSRPVVLSQGHYGAKRGVDALLQLFADEAFRTTFFIPGWVARRYPDVVTDIVEAGHFVGHHGYEHERLVDDVEVERDILRRGLTALEEVAGIRPRGYAAPGWVMTPHTFDLLVEHGFDYSVNMMDDLLPYIVGRPGGSIVELPVHWLLDDAPFRLGGRGNAKPIAPVRDVLDIWLEELAGIHEVGGLFNLTIHPQVSGRPSMVRALRVLFRQIHDLGSIWVTTCEEITDFVRSSGSGDFRDERSDPAPVPEPSVPRAGRRAP